MHSQTLTNTIHRTSDTLELHPHQIIVLGESPLIRAILL